MGRSRKVTEAPAPKEEQPAVEGAENIPVQEVPILPQTCTHTGTALIIADSISEADWLALGAPLANVQRATPFYIGDWLTFGQNKNFIQSDKYDHAEKVTGMKRSTLKLYAFVSRNVSPLVRTNGLSFAHHQLVASLPTEEQKTWLEKAKGLTVRRFRTFIQTYTGNKPVPRKRTLKMMKRKLDRVIKDCRDLPGLEDVVKAIDAIQTGS
jgi:hypothetical protein